MTNFILGMLYTILLIAVSFSSGVSWISWRNGKALEPSKKLKAKKMSKKEKEKILEEWKHVPMGVVKIVKPNYNELNKKTEELINSWENDPVTHSDYNAFIDNYKMEWLLRDEIGKEWCEYHENISLSDFEIIYGNNVHEIIMVELRLQDHV